MEPFWPTSFNGSAQTVEVWPDWFTGFYLLPSSPVLIPCDYLGVFCKIDATYNIHCVKVTKLSLDLISRFHVTNWLHMFKRSTSVWTLVSEAATLDVNLSFDHTGTVRLKTMISIPLPKPLWAGNQSATSHRWACCWAASEAAVHISYAGKISIRLTASVCDYTTIPRALATIMLCDTWLHKDMCAKETSNS